MLERSVGGLQNQVAGTQAEMGRLSAACRAHALWVSRASLRLHAATLRRYTGGYTAWLNPRHRSAAATAAFRAFAPLPGPLSLQLHAALLAMPPPPRECVALHAETEASAAAAARRRRRPRRCTGGARPWYRSRRDSRRQERRRRRRRRRRRGRRRWRRRRRRRRRRTPLARRSSAGTASRKPPRNCPPTGASPPSPPPTSSRSATRSVSVRRADGTGAADGGDGAHAEGIEVDRAAELAEGRGGRFEAAVRTGARSPSYFIQRKRFNARRLAARARGRRCGR